MGGYSQKPADKDPHHRLPVYYVESYSASSYGYYSEAHVDRSLT